MAECSFCDGSGKCPDKFHDEKFDPGGFYENMVNSVFSECPSCGGTVLPRPDCPDCDGSGEEQ